ncbi:hypothetical protein [Companilactobacillus sp.]|jgi:hypothetical protein|uniref:hypothetical protein n=1 Tax=Companilactobacillus sp. TaxID=2767905 RepID=UPI0025C0EE8E|nr:hypothetical protein [Companilactobacillus sp.]MCH4009933.1 hypothetical protein [Companilactobacillus sp.]MCH4052391.1 hypothetical protein [Companilactobacillus sp.]MCH4077875.1 hypothetical protein [Companilactobacillus sp.]MCH4126451.1 hypothetical protein [Companilactobacillus sp.]MCH4132037.1 hypothetical protein [Companilactobacillus sp.]
MNKIKFAGVAAAALLAITPATTTTLAASNNVEPVGTSKAVGDSINFNDLLNKVGNYFVDQIKQLINNKQPNNTPASAEDQATAVINGIKDVSYDENHPISIYSSDFDGKIATPIDSDTFAHLLGDIGLTNEGQGKIIASGAKYRYRISGTSSDTPDDIITKINQLHEGNGNQVVLTFESLDSNNQVKNKKSVTFTNNIKAVTTANSLNINYKTPIYVPVGSKTQDVQLSNSATGNTTVDNNHGQNVAFKAMKAWSLYSNQENARNFNHPLDLGTKFMQKDATYYQPVTIYFDPNKININDLTQESMQSQDTVFNINGQNVKWEQINQHDLQNSVTYVREIKVGQEPTKPNDNNNNNNNQNNNGNKDDNQKPTNPADPVGVWKTEDHNGIVAVGSHVADLVDEDSSYTTRSLAPHTKWQTNATRVNTVTGAKQYRVSTNEWVSAEDVNFQDAAPKFFNNVLQYPGYQTVHLAGPSGFIYALFNQDGVRLDRALQGDSAWATDERATDFDGNIYYRVSTNEWVKTGNGVSVN